MLFVTLMTTAAISSAFAQSPDLLSAPPAFEAVSIIKSAPNIPMVRFKVGPESLQAENLSLEELIERAFGLMQYQVSVPDWMNESRFVIIARASGPVSRNQMMVMLQTVLQDRFHLTFHWADKTMPVYVLGPEGDHHGLAVSQVPEDDPKVGFGPGAQEPLKRVLKYTHVTMQTLAQSLTGSLVHADLPVIDGTGLNGYFDLTLKFNLTGPPPSQIEDGDVPVAVSSQLGISIKRTNTPVKQFVVDHADQAPTEN